MVLVGTPLLACSASNGPGASAGTGGAPVDATGGGGAGLVDGSTDGVDGEASGEANGVGAGSESDADGGDAMVLPIDAAVDVAGVAPEAGPIGGAFENSLGMRFVRVAGTAVFFSVWETRVQDYQAYALATGTPVPHPDFPETALQPKASTSRAQAEDFAAWLTAKEQKERTIPAASRYRLPTDAEWDAAVGAGSTYPWGNSFPPPDHFANYAVSNDGFTYTAPVGSFAANEQGLYDTAGNLWEWIGEGCASGGAFLVRGAGWNAAGASYMTRSFHYCFGADLVGHHNVGFRVVLEGLRVMR
jgi:hypothetical protein